MSLLKMKNDPDCQSCALHKTANTVCLLGNGPKRSDVMIIGEAPGKTEDETGEPFAGRSGALLNKLLAKAGIDREDVYVCNAVSCRPPDNRTPKKTEIAACREWLEYQIAMVKPKYILTLGNIPLQSLLGITGVKKHRGKPIEKDGITILPTFHPAFALRDDRQEFVLAKDLQAFKDIIDFGGIPEERELNYTIIDSWPKFRAMLKKLRGIISFDLETSGLYPWGLLDLATKEREKTYITSICIGTQYEQFVIPLNHCESQLTADGWQSLMPGARQQSDKPKLAKLAQHHHKAQMKLWNELVPVLQECELVYQNGKFDAVWTWVKTG